MSNRNYNMLHSGLRSESRVHYNVGKWQSHSHDNIGS